MSTPLAKLLVETVPPVALAGLLYLGAGIGFPGWRAEARDHALGATPGSSAGAVRSGLNVRRVLVGGVIAPVLLMLGLERTSGSSVAIMPSLEGAFTALLAWFVFGENGIDRKALGLAKLMDGKMCPEDEGEVAAWRQGLDFVPVSQERFDLGMRRRTYFQPQRQTLLRFARTERFRSRAESLGGYDLTGHDQVCYNV